jgi:hypothetical protein
VLRGSKKNKGGFTWKTRQQGEWNQLASLEVGQRLVFEDTDIYKVCSAIQRYKVVTHGRKFTAKTLDCVSVRVWRLA